MSKIPLSINNIDIKNDPKVTNVRPSKPLAWDERKNIVEFEWLGITYTGELENGIVKDADLLFIEKYYEF